MPCEYRENCEIYAGKYVNSPIISKADFKKTLCDKVEGVPKKGKCPLADRTSDMQEILYK